MSFSKNHCIFGDFAWAVEPLLLQARFEQENLKHVGTMSQGLYGNQAVGKWAQALTTQWGCILYCASAFVCVELARQGRMPAGHMGLVLLYSAQLQRDMMDYMSRGRTKPNGESKWVLCGAGVVYAAC